MLKIILRALFKRKIALAINGALLVVVAAVLKLKGMENATYMLIAGTLFQFLSAVLFVLEDWLKKPSQKTTK